MKSLNINKGILLLLFIFNIQTGYTQELSRSGESYLKFYKLSAQKLNKMDPSAMGYDTELQKAENNLKLLKKSDPNYDASELTNEIAEYKSKLKDAEKRSEENEKAYDDLDEELQNFLTEQLDGHISVHTEADLQSLQTKMKTYEKNFGNYIQTKLISNENIKYILPKIEDYWKDGAGEKNGGDKSKMNSFINFIKKSTDLMSAMGQYDFIQLLKIKWSLLSHAFPESTILKNAMDESEKTAAFITGKDELVKLVNANNYEIAKLVRMDAAVTKDVAFEGQIRATLQNSSFGKGRSIVKINILSTDWNTERNSLTGIIIARTKKFQAVLKETDGSCRLQTIWYKQDYNGSNYGTAYLIKLDNGKQILCENVDK